MTTDKYGRQILKGDVLKIFHFIGARRKKHYMYKHVTDLHEGFFTISNLDRIPTSYLMRDDNKRHEHIEIVQGFGDGLLSFEYRVKYDS